MDGSPTEGWEDELERWLEPLLHPMLEKLPSGEHDTSEHAHEIALEKRAHEVRRETDPTARDADPADPHQHLARAALRLRPVDQAQGLGLLAEDRFHRRSVSASRWVRRGASTAARRP